MNWYLRIGNLIKFQFIQFLDKFLGNFLNYERKTNMFTTTLRGDQPTNLANLVGNIGTLMRQ